ncbi:hypothetical protein L6452_37370 [Arctium lappa]|uniref:Uncharacterized protein n=1 Tax=Arctium lappa TaxID=4217 RepID=A0ACB8Y3G8_ARCLA|nr:hypothetical protein L6452_37370 [Arctium lappa]
METSMVGQHWIHSQVSVDAGVDVDASLFTSEAVNDDVVLAFDSMKCNSSHIVVGNSQSEDCFWAEVCFVHDVEVNDEGIDDDS